MRIQAIICEYNPFHTGHAYQIQAGKKTIGSTHTLALMSGSIVQRGSFALCDKWTRAQSALLAGADLVCELPYAYAGQSAEFFARGAIKILNSLNCCHFLSFGSESGNLEPLKKVAALLSQEPPAFKNALKAGLSKGLSFPKARELAFEALYGENFSLYLREPNNILGIEYLKALLITKSHLTPITIKRQGSGYHDQTLQSHYASASAIRESIKKNSIDLNLNLKQLLPYNPDILLKKINTDFSNQEQGFTKALYAKIMSADLGSFRQLPYMEDGMEFKFKTALKSAKTYDELVMTLSSKRIPESRIRRILMALMLDFHSEHLTQFSAETFHPYLRVLGFNEKGQAMLKTIREKASIPIITNTRTNITRLTQDQRRCFEFDLLATDLFSLFCEKNYCYHQDFLQSPLRLPQKECS